MPLAPTLRSGSESEFAAGAAVILAAIAVLGFVFRRSGARQPAAVFQPLGQFTLLDRETAYLVRFGNKLLALAQTAHGLEKITEISDPAEVSRITRMCLAGRSVKDGPFPFNQQTVTDVLQRTIA